MGSTPRRRLDPDARRDQILHDATRVFRHHEFSTVSMEQIAEAAGVTRGLLHHYFGSKRDLYLAVVAHATAVPAELRLVPVGAEGDLAEVLRVSVDTWMRLVESSGGLWAGGDGVGFGSDDLDVVLRRARDDLVERMLVELPLPDGLDRAILRTALRAYAAFARSVTDEWINGSTLSRADATRLLHRTLVAIVEGVRPGGS